MSLWYDSPFSGLERDILNNLRIAPHTAPELAAWLETDRHQVLAACKRLERLGWLTSRLWTGKPGGGRRPLVFVWVQP